MATMIPSDIEYFKTDGEKVFYNFLKDVAKPDNKYIAWYLPDIKGNEPDFLLFAHQIGLIIFEVKDWDINQIIEANPQYFLLNIGGRTESRTNPYRQVKAYFDYVMEKLKEDRYLLSKDPEHLGKTRIPVSCGVVFPNINRLQFMETGLSTIINPEATFFWDDLYLYSEFIKNNNSFLEKLKSMFTPKFPYVMNHNDIDHLKQLFFTEIKVFQPERSLQDEYTYHRDRIKVLDIHQEAIARKYDSGHRIIIGPSGSGKTQILASKAAFLRKYNPSIKSILFVCYNITLVNYIKRLLSDKKVPLGPDGVEVYHFFELCSEILGENIHYENEDSSYYETVIELTSNRLDDINIKYDAVLVDEGQDFTDDMLRIVTGLLNKKTDSFTIALDERQNIYKRSKTWKEIGIKAQGRVHRLDNIYRNTKEITEFVFKVTGKSTKQEESGQEELFPTFFDFHGPQPQVKQFTSIEDIVNYVADTIKMLSEKEGYPLSEIAIIYPIKTPQNKKDIHIPKIMGKALLSRGIISYWSSEDYRAKRSYDITTNSVTISTIHSAKGLDYACVFLIGFDYLIPDRPWSEEQIDSLFYVAATRARHRLFIPYTEKTPLMEKLLAQA